MEMKTGLGNTTDTTMMLRVLVLVMMSHTDDTGNNNNLRSESDALPSGTNESCN
jgi:hypothetical protein